MKKHQQENTNFITLYRCDQGHSACIGKPSKSNRIEKTHKIFIKQERESDSSEEKIVKNQKV